MSRNKKKDNVYLDSNNFDSFLNQISDDDVASVNTNASKILSAEGKRSLFDELADKINLRKAERENMTQAERLYEDYGAYAEGNVSGDVTGIGSWWKSKTGKGLTNAQMATNAFNAWQAEEARNFDERMANTQYQRTVADMQAAGVNPALAMSNSINAAPSSPAAQATSPQATADFGIGGLFGSIVSLLKGVKEMKLMGSQVKLNEANADKAEADAEKTRRETAWVDKLNEAEVASKNAGTRLTDQQYENAKEEKQLIINNVKKAEEECKTEVAKRALMRVQENLASAQTYEIYQIVPYKELLMSAQTDAQRAEANYKIVQTAWQQGLINGGYIDAMCEEMRTRNMMNQMEYDKLVEEVKLLKENIKTAKNVNAIRNHNGPGSGFFDALLEIISAVFISIRSR